MSRRLLGPIQAALWLLVIAHVACGEQPGNATAAAPGAKAKKPIAPIKHTLRCGPAGEVVSSQGELSDDAPQLSKANLNRNKKFIYALKMSASGRSELRIQRSITLTKPLVLGSGMSVYVDKGATLTLTAQPMFGRSPLFNGPGMVKFAGNRLMPFHVFPEWWARSREAKMGRMSNALNRISEACRDVMCRVVIASPILLDSTWQLTPNITVWSSRGATMTSTDKSVVALDFVPGDYTKSRRYTLPQMVGFKTCAQVRDVNGLRLYIISAAQGKEGVALRGKVSNTAITVFTQAMIGTGFSIAATSLDNVRMFTWFLLGTTKDSLTAGAHFAVAPTRLRDTVIQFRAADGKSKEHPFPSLALLRNSATQPVPDLQFVISSWGGNYLPSTRMVAGQFRNLRLWAKMTKPYPATMSGAGNTITLDGSEILRSYALANSPAKLRDVIQTNFATVVLDPAHVAGGWAPDAIKDFYLRHTLLSHGGQSAITLSPGPIAAGAYSFGRNWENPGIVVQQVVDESSIEPRRLRVRLANVSGRFISGKEFAATRIDWRLYVAVPGVGKAGR